MTHHDILQLVYAVVGLAFPAVWFYQLWKM